MRHGFKNGLIWILEHFSGETENLKYRNLLRPGANIFVCLLFQCMSSEGAKSGCVKILVVFLCL